MEAALSKILRCSPVLSLLLMGLGACSSTDTKTITEIPACSPSYPNGACATVGQECYFGTCVTSTSLCSESNLTGTCRTGETCFGGGCVPSTSLCSATSPTGPCPIGSTCFQGACVATGSLCSSGNLTGTCPTGKTCTQGVCAAPGVDPCTVNVYTTQPTVAVDTSCTPSATVTCKSLITVEGLQFRDLSGDGKLDLYEDWRKDELCRAKDLATKLSAAEKVGLMSETTYLDTVSTDGTLPANVQTNIVTNHIRQALIRLGARSPAQMAVYTNNVQKLCEQQPWGVPFVITTDPSHGLGLSSSAAGAQSYANLNIMSPWPYPLGLAAINDADVTKQYGDTVRREFMAIGFRWQLGPMADIASEPRWARVQNTFGEGAYGVAKHTRACIEGFQGTGQGGLKNGIAATMKHFPGAGANEDGMDSHTRPGKYSVYPGGYFAYHQIPFMAAIDAGAAAVMPCYSIFKDQLDYEPEQTGAAFSHALITKYLKDELGFTGMVTSDWGTLSGTPWGVETLTPPERAAMFVKAGSDQLGMDSFTIMQTAYDQGLLTDADLNRAAAKILEMSFKLGIFEDPYVADATAAEVRSTTNLTNGFIAQKKAIVILRNTDHNPTGAAPKYLPLSGARYTDKNTNNLPDAGEYIDDTNNDGKVSVYFDGVTDALNGADIYTPVFGADYDFRSAASGTGATAALAVEAAADAKTADIAVLRITARKGQYFGLDAGVPLSFDKLFPGTMAEVGRFDGVSSYAPAVNDAHKVIDLLRIRDGYRDSTGATVAATNPTLKIVLVMHMDRPGIVRPFINGLVSLDETAGVAGSYPMVSNEGNTRTDGKGGVDAFLVDFGAYDRALLELLFNTNVPTTPTGYAYGQSRLPMEIPSSDGEVEAQFEDVPADTHFPTYALGAGGGL